MKSGDVGKVRGRLRLMLLRVRVMMGTTLI